VDSRSSWPIKQDRLKIVYLTDVHGERVVVLQVNWID